MDNLELMAVFDGTDDLLEEPTSFVLWHSTTLDDIVE
jgi:hypothetical protein